MLEGRQAKGNVGAGDRFTVEAAHREEKEEEGEEGVGNRTGRLGNRPDCRSRGGADKRAPGDKSGASFTLPFR